MRDGYRLWNRNEQTNVSRVKKSAFGTERTPRAFSALSQICMYKRKKKKKKWRSLGERCRRLSRKSKTSAKEACWTNSRWLTAPPIFANVVLFHVIACTELLPKIAVISSTELFPIITSMASFTTVASKNLSSVTASMVLPSNLRCSRRAFRTKYHTVYFCFISTGSFLNCRERLILAVWRLILASGFSFRSLNSKRIKARHFRPKVSNETPNACRRTKRILRRKTCLSQ